MKKLLLSALVAATAAVSFQAQAAGPEVSASVSASNFYLWRGTNLGKGDAQIAGDINVSQNGFYAGTWAASGDSASGTEIDLYLGYGAEVGAFNYDLSYWSYIYPESNTDLGEAAEVVAGLGYGPVSFAYYHNVSKDADDKKWNYMTLGAEMGKFGITFGKHNKHSNDGLLHADLSYAYNDNLTFTVSQPLEVDTKDASAGNTLVNVNLALPLKF